MLLTVLLHTQNTMLGPRSGSMIKKIVFCVFIFTALSLIYYCNKVLEQNGYYSSVKIVLSEDIVDFSDANNVTGFDNYIVPNVVHFIHFESTSLSFIEVVSIRAAYLNHQPEKIIIHCNCHALSGKYWNMVKNITILEVRYMEKPTHIFQKPLSSVYHSSDIARIKILMKYGGIYLDSDSYVVKSLNYYRKFEMAIGWHPGQSLGTQVLIAHRNARFLKLWFNSYKYYRGERWYYNAGELPTQMILERMPHLVHRVKYDFGVHILVHMLYAVHSEEWKKFHCIHLLVRHKSYLVKEDPIVEFNEENIKTYNKTFGDMARLAIYGSSDFII